MLGSDLRGDEYDDGRLTEVWNPNRLHDYPSSPQPSTLRESHTTRLSAGWLERVATLDWTGSPKLSTSYEYDLCGTVTRVTNKVRPENLELITPATQPR